MKDIHNKIASTKSSMGIGILIFMVLITFPWFYAEASEYYIDSLDGNDFNSGTSPAVPWRTLDKVNSVKYYPGDVIYFKCGQMWRGQLNVSSSGSYSNPIKFKSYGSNCSSGTKPIINSSRNVNGWRRYSGNIYVADVQVSDVKQMVFNGQIMILARYPDSEYLSITRDSLPGEGIEDGAQFLYYYALPDIFDQSSLYGAGIHVRTVDWLIEDREISSFEPANNKLIWRDKTNYAVRKDYGFYLDNKLWMLDQQGEWYFDRDNKKLYAWMFNDKNPDDPGLSIEISDRDYAVNIASVENVLLENIEIRNSALDGISINAANRIVISNCTVSNSGRNGINILRSPNSTVKNSEVRGSVKDGINVRFSDGTVITGNYIENTGTVGSPVRSNGAIYMRNSMYSVIQNNKILNSGYAGIYFTRGASVLNNIVENSCLVLNDCGAIYTWNDYDFRAAYDSEIMGNIIDGVMGNPEGTPGSASLARGIYLDEYSNGIHVLKNTVVNASEYGICLHNAFNNRIENNTLFGKGESQLAILEGGGLEVQGIVKGNTITNNIMFPLNINEPILLRGEFNNINFGFFNNNVFPLFYSKQVILEMYRSNYPVYDGFSVNSFNLPAWQQERNAYAATNKTIAPFGIMSYKVTRINSNNLISNGSFDNNFASWEVWSTKQDSRKDYISNCNASGGCLKFTSGLKSVDNLLGSNSFYVQAGKTYQLSLSAKALQTNLSAQLIIRRGESPYESIGLEKVISANNNGWSKFHYIFVANDTLFNAQLHFDLPLGQAALLLDDITIEEVIVEHNDTSDDASILINKTSETLYVYCSGTDIQDRCDQYIDLEKNHVVWPVLLQPYNSKIIIWAYNPFRGLNPPKNLIIR